MVAVPKDGSGGSEGVTGDEMAISSLVRDQGASQYFRPPVPRRNCSLSCTDRSRLPPAELLVERAEPPDEPSSDCHEPLLESSSPTEFSVWSSPVTLPPPCSLIGVAIDVCETVDILVEKGAEEPKIAGLVPCKFWFGLCAAYHKGDGQKTGKECLRRE